MTIPKKGQRKVYFMRSEYSGLTKIGVTDNIPLRLKRVSTGAGPVNLIKHIPAGRSHLVERYIHHLLKEQWIYGEWFKVEESEIEAACIQLRKDRRSSRFTRICFTLPPIWRECAK